MKASQGGARRWYWSSVTIAERSAAVGHRSTGFDYLRLALATSIICFHSVALSYGRPAEAALDRTIVGPFAAAIVPMFFALSGYLVAASLDRCATLISFLGLRVLRLCPALAVETVLSAFILGPIFTTFSMPRYWSDPTLWRYLGNIIGDIHYALPGVFDHLPEPHLVNGQLWTIRTELLSYATLALLTLIGLRRWRILAPVMLILAPASLLLVSVLLGVNVLARLGSSWTEAGLVAVFLMGVGVHKYRELIPWSHPLGIASGVVSIACLSFPHGQYIAYAPLVYFTTYLGLFNPRKIALLAGDYSYGMYLYGFVIQQSFASLGEWARVWWLSCLVCAPTALVVAAASWHMVEKPAQTLRRRLYRLETALTGRQSTIANKTPYAS